MTPPRIHDLSSQWTGFGTRREMFTYANSLADVVSERIGLLRDGTMVQVETLLELANELQGLRHRGIILRVGEGPLVAARVRFSAFEWESYSRMFAVLDDLNRSVSRLTAARRGQLLVARRLTPWRTLFLSGGMDFTNASLPAAVCSELDLFHKAGSDNRAAAGVKAMRKYTDFLGNEWLREAAKPSGMPTRAIRAACDQAAEGAFLNHSMQAMGAKYEPEPISWEESIYYITRAFTRVNEAAGAAVSEALEQGWVDGAHTRGKSGGVSFIGDTGSNPILSTDYTPDTYGFHTLAHEFGHLVQFRLAYARAPMAPSMLGAEFAACVMSEVASMELSKARPDLELSLMDSRLGTVFTPLTKHMFENQIRTRALNGTLRARDFQPAWARANTLVYGSPGDEEWYECGQVVTQPGYAQVYVTAQAAATVAVNKDPKAAWNAIMSSDTRTASEQLLRLGMDVTTTRGARQVVSSALEILNSQL